MTIRHKAPWAIAALMLVACNGDKDTGNEKPVTTTDPPTTTDPTNPQGSWSLDATIPTTSTAGTTHDLAVTVTADDGSDATADAAITITVSPDAGVTQADDDVTFTVATLHEVTVTASLDDWTETLTGQVTVDDGGATVIDLVLDATESPAGSPVEASWTLTDDYGNDATGTVVLSVSPDPGVVLAGTTLTGELAGTYDITAAVTETGASDTEELDIIGGAAVSLDLELSAYDAEVGDTVTATVTGLDAFGNPTDSPYTLDVDPATATLKGDLITFDADALYTVTATDGKASDAEQVVVDGNGPLIVVNGPRRASYRSGSPATITGSVVDNVTGVDTVTLNGDILKLDKSGGFSVTTATDTGVNILNLQATDLDGNVADLHMSFMAGDYLATGSELSDAIEAHLNQAALDTLGSDFESAFSKEEIEAEILASNPLIDSWSDCWPWDLVLDVNATSFDYSDLVIELQPRHGELRVIVTIEDLNVDLDGYYEACIAFGDISGWVEATTTTMTVDLDLNVGAGGIVATTTASDVTFTGFDAELTGVGGFIDDALAFFGFDVDTEVEALVRSELLQELDSTVPEAIEDAFSGLTISTVIDFGVPLTLDGGLQAVDVSPDGITIILESTITGGTVHPDIPTVDGSVLMGGTKPAYDSSPGFFLGVNLDLLNQLLHGAWESGALNMTMTHDDLGLDPILIGLLFPGATTLELDILPQMAPVTSPGSGTEPIDLFIGELQIEMTGDVGGVDTYLGTLSVQAMVGMELSYDALGVVMTPGTPITWADYMDPDINATQSHENLEVTIESLAPTLMPELLTEYGFELPDIPGFTYTLTEIDANGAWIVAGGDLN